MPTAWVASGSDGWGSPETVVIRCVSGSSMPATTGRMCGRAWGPLGSKTDGPGRISVSPGGSGLGAHHGGGGSLMRGDGTGAHPSVLAVGRYAPVASATVRPTSHPVHRPKAAPALAAATRLSK